METIFIIFRNRKLFSLLLVKWTKHSVTTAKKNKTSMSDKLIINEIKTGGT